ncbi:hypothetical protein AAY473_008818, partial [Plecturocebus cupreus]
MASFYKGAFGQLLLRSQLETAAPLPALYVLSPLLLLLQLQALALVPLVHNLSPRPWVESADPTQQPVTCLLRRQDLTTSSRLECSGCIIAHCRLKLLNSSDPSASVSHVAGTA